MSMSPIKKFIPHEAFHFFILSGFPDTDRAIPGVYIISDIYLGASKHIRRRLIWHYHQLRRGRHTNKKLQKAFNERDFVDVKYLSDDPKKEREFVSLLSEPLKSKSRFYDENIDY